MVLNDVHGRFFSEGFFAALGRERREPCAAADVLSALGWDAPGPAAALADRWIRELDGTEKNFGGNFGPSLSVGPPAVRRRRLGLASAVGDDG